MKKILIIILLGLIWNPGNTTNPIKGKTWFIELKYSNIVYQEYQQIGFKPQNFKHGYVIEFGNRTYPLSIAYRRNFNLTHDYLKFRIVSNSNQFNLKYNLNKLSYRIPHGIDPYIGAGLVRQTINFQEFELDDANKSNPLSQYVQTSLNYNLCAGLKIGNNNVTLGFQYDLFPNRFAVPNEENTSLDFFDTKHLFSFSVGWRIHSIKPNKIRCPKFRNQQKRFIKF